MPYISFIDCWNSLFLSIVNTSNISCLPINIIIATTFRFIVDTLKLILNVHFIIPGRKWWGPCIFFLLFLINFVIYFFFFFFFFFFLFRNFRVEFFNRFWGQCFFCMMQAFFYL